MKQHLAFLFAGLLFIQQAFSGIIVMRRVHAAGGGGGGAAAFSDDFNRADSTNIGANWTEAAGDVDISSNALRQVTGSYGTVLVVHNTTTNTVNQYVKFQCTNDGGYFCAVILRYQNSSSGFYVLYHDQNAVWEWNYYPSTGGGSSVIGSVDVGTFVDGDNYGITIEGTGTSTVIRIWKNPTANSPVSATEWDSGDTTPDGTLTNDPATPANVGTYVGLGAASSVANTVRMDNFYGGDIP